MARPKKETLNQDYDVGTTGGGSPIVTSEPVPNTLVPTKIAKLSVDYGREDLNNIAIKINEIIDTLNGTQS